jgi:hypothetical protein
MQQMHAPLPAAFNRIYPDFLTWDDHCVHFYRMLDEQGNDRHWPKTFYYSGHIRSNYAYRIDIAREIKFPEYSGQTGFSEETYFCAKAWIMGYSVLINPNAIAWHLNAPYGGGRDIFAGKTPEQAQAVIDEIKKRNLAKLAADLTEFRTLRGEATRGYPLIRALQ